MDLLEKYSFLSLNKKNSLSKAYLMIGKLWRKKRQNKVIQILKL